MNLETLKTEWQDTESYHKHIHELFTELVNADHVLNEHRTWVEQNVWGFGERSFWWLWKIICDELPPDFSFCEVGVFKGATLSVIKLLRPDAKIFGITPLDSTGIDWEDDYLQRIQDIHDKFNNGKKPTIFHGRSDNEQVIKLATNLLYDCLYVDGGHARVDIDNDLKFYAPMVKIGGYLVIDDACCEMSMSFGYFQGILPVTEGVIEYMVHHSSEWEFITNVVHLRVYRRR